MRTVFVNKKSEITAEAAYWQKIGCKVYRTRLQCNCGRNNTRNGAIIIDIDHVHIMSLVRCKACASTSLSNQEKGGTQ